MLGDTYQTTQHPDNNSVYFFVSKGKQGDILKVVLFQRYKVRNKYNLAFGDVQNGILNDEIVSNNSDFVKVLATVAKCIYDFLARNQDAIIFIHPVDDRRRVLYNTICQRHFETLTANLNIWGRKGRFKELLIPHGDYDSFEISRKS